MKIGHKLILGFMVLNVALIASGILMGAMISKNMEETMIYITKEETAKFVNLQANAHLDKNAFDGQDFENARMVFGNFFREIRLDSVLRIKVWNRNATVIYSNNPDIVGKPFPDNHEFQEAIRGEVDVEIKPKEKPENIDLKGYEQLMEVYVPITFEGTAKPAGVIEVYVKLDDLNRQIAEARADLWRTIALGVLALTILSFVLAAFLSRRITGPITSLKNAAQRVGKGRLDTKIDVKSGDEIEDLAAAFGQMTGNLKQSKAEIDARHNELHKSKRQLELKVIELERFNRLTIGRELKMIELKKRLAELERVIGQKKS